MLERLRVHELTGEPLGDAAPEDAQTIKPAAHQTATLNELIEIVQVVNPRRPHRLAEGTRDVTEHLEKLPGDTWNERWAMFEATILDETWQEQMVPESTYDRRQRLVAPVMALIAGDVFRPSYAWTQKCNARFTAVVQSRDSADLELFRATAAQLDHNPRTVDVAVRSLGQIQAHTGKALREIEPADLFEMRDAIYRVVHQCGLPLAWRAMHALGWISHNSHTLPPRRRGSQKSCAQMISSHGITGRFAEVMTEYLKHRGAGLDYPTRKAMARNIAGLYWRDMLRHHPDLTTFAVTHDQIDAWKKRLSVKSDGTPRAEVFGVMHAVRAFYLDIAHWALQDSYWAEWVAPSPIYFTDLKGYKKARRRVIAETQHRTRELAPALPQLVEAAERERRSTAAALEAAKAAGHGGSITLGGQPWTVFHLTDSSPFRARRDDQEKNLSEQEDNAFWAWALIEVLRHTGIRHEELLELTHLAIQPYKVPATGETIPLLHVAPSKTDQERLLVAGPELVHVLTAVLARVRNGAASVPLSQRWDPHEKILGEPLPHLFAKRVQTEYRVISQAAVIGHIQRVTELAGITVNGKPARITPLDLRRIFATEALASGLPPHIVQVLMGHKNIATTQGYAAIYPADVIRHHRTFIAQRRQYRPSEEYREPTTAEWEEFQAHFVTRKLSLGSCGRAYGTGCHHEHACVRCSLLRPDPAQHDRLSEIVTNLTDRIAEAQEQGWLGEVEGLEVTLAAARHKLDQMERLQAQPTGPTLLGMPGAAGQVRPTRIEPVGTNARGSAPTNQA